MIFEYVIYGLAGLFLIFVLFSVIKFIIAYRGQK